MLRQEILALACAHHGLPRTRSKEGSDRAPGKIDRVDAARKSQEWNVKGVPAIILILKLSFKALARLRPGRGKPIRSETAKEMMVIQMAADQAALSLVKIPAFVAWLRLVPAFHVESAAIAIAPEEWSVHEGGRGCQSRKILAAIEIGQLVPLEIGPGAHRAAAHDVGHGHLPSLAI